MSVFIEIGIGGAGDGLRIKSKMLDKSFGKMRLASTEFSMEENFFVFACNF